MRRTVAPGEARSFERPPDGLGSQTFLRTNQEVLSCPNRGREGACRPLGDRDRRDRHPRPLVAVETAYLPPCWCPPSPERREVRSPPHSPRPRCSSVGTSDFLSSTPGPPGL